jgi:hypothetical protein
MSGVKMEKPASMIEWLHPVAQFPNLSILTQNNIHTVWTNKSKFSLHPFSISSKNSKSRLCSQVRTLANSIYLPFLAKAVFNINKFQQSLIVYNFIMKGLKSSTWLNIINLALKIILQCSNLTIESIFSVFRTGWGSFADWWARLKKQLD